jgi:adenosylmethionine-8-amino-7-oxononanoate aminotransferase
MSLADNSQAHPTACAAAIAVQKIIKRDNLLDNVKEMGTLLESELRSQLSDLPYVGDIRGRGLFWAVEFVADTKEKNPFGVEDNFSNRIVETAMELGLNILGNLGETGKYYIDLVIISPPYIINQTEVRKIVELLKEAVLKVSDDYRLAKVTSIKVEDRGGDAVIDPVSVVRSTL